MNVVVSGIKKMSYFYCMGGNKILLLAMKFGCSQRKLVARNKIILFMMLRIFIQTIKFIFLRLINKITYRTYNPKSKGVPNCV